MGSALIKQCVTHNLNNVLQSLTFRSVPVRTTTKTDAGCPGSEWYHKVVRQVIVGRHGDGDLWVE